MLGDRAMQSLNVKTPTDKLVRTLIVDGPDELAQVGADVICEMFCSPLFRPLGLSICQHDRPVRKGVADEEEAVHRGADCLSLAEGCAHGLHAERPDDGDNLSAEVQFPVKDEILWRGVEGNVFAQLLD